MKTDDGVLTGLKVIDCATYVAGPAAATILSDFGADVIKSNGRQTAICGVRSPQFPVIQVRISTTPGC